MIDELVLKEFRALDSWQIRVMGVKGPIEETYYNPSYGGSDVSLKRGVLTLTIEVRGRWYLSCIIGGQLFHLTESTLFIGKKVCAPSRTLAEMSLYRHIERGLFPWVLPKLDMFQKVYRYLARHPELAMTWTVSKEILFREAALEVINV